MKPSSRYLRHILHNLCCDNRECAQISAATTGVFSLTLLDRANATRTEPFSVCLLTARQARPRCRVLPACQVLVPTACRIVILLSQLFADLVIRLVIFGRV